MIPQILRNFALFVDGKGYAGRAEEVNLPKLTLKTEEYRGGGMDAPFEVDLGMDKLEASATLTEYNADVLKLFGIMAGSATQMTFRGAAQKQGDDAAAIIATIRGRIKEIDPGSWKQGEKATLKFAVAVSYYKLNIAGSDVIEIDVENCKRIIGGTDQLASVRTALGI